jgi:predicted nuclease of predicted toxin-antitoxin system
MQVLFDQGTPVPLCDYLPAHTVTTVFEKRWNTMQNGELLLTAEREGFQVLVTTDQNLRHQQNLRGRQIAIVVLMTTNWRRIERSVSDAVMAIDSAKPGHYVEVGF